MIRLRFGGADKATERMLSLWYETADHSSQIALRGKSHPFEVITINSPESVSQLPFAATFGFDALEQVKGEPEFRWAGLVSGIHFDLDSGPHSIVLSLANVRNPASSIATIAFFNEEKVESKDVVQTDDEIIFKVESPDSGHSRFLLFCDPLEAPDDFRSLGLPITGIRVLSPDPE